MKTPQEIAADVYWTATDATTGPAIRALIVAGIEADRAQRDESESEPAWYGAKDGEIWVVTVEGLGEFPTQVDDYSGFPRFISLMDGMGYGPRAGIIAGRRIWPENAS